jgi:TrmH family RNA methyltransferase
VHVTSRQNAIVKRFREAPRRGGADGIALLDGPHLVGEALAAGVTIEVVALASDAAEGRFADLAAQCETAGAQVITVPGSLLAGMTPVQQTTGVVALARLRPAPLDAVLRATPPQLVLVLDHVQDPGNVGAIIRVGEACGASGIVVGPGTADPFGWKALRGSMGSTFRLPVALAGSMAEAGAAARAAGLRRLATVPRGGTPLERADLVAPAAIFVGGEGAGLEPAALAAADERLTIAMRPPVESLNVSIAAALVVYEAARQRSHVAV